jgi:very-short-patch-repair endonuclease
MPSCSGWWHVGIRAYRHSPRFPRPQLRRLQVSKANGVSQSFRSTRGARRKAHPQVGVAKYRIDIGIVHPDKPRSYILGLECDGATYHSSKAARDRDRLRQSVLEELNWRIYRVWSTDWYRDPEREFARLIQNIESARDISEPSFKVLKPHKSMLLGPGSRNPRRVLLLELSRSNPSLKGPDSHRLFFAFGHARRECLLAPSGRRKFHNNGSAKRRRRPLSEIP